MTETAPDTRPRRQKRRRWPWLFALVPVLLIVMVAWVGIRGFLARENLEEAIPLAQTLQQQIVGGGGEGATETYAELSDRASTAASLTGDPIWRLAELVPVAGPNLTAVRELAGVVDDVSRDAVGPLVQVAGGIDIDDFRPVDGAVDLQPIVDAQPSVSAAAAAMSSAAERVAAIDSDDTLDPVRDAVDRLRSTVGEADAALDAVDRAARLLPAMLGADGPRNYLLIFQNPAELRSGGGIAGALALVSTDGGRISLTQQAGSGDFPRYPESVIDLPAETTNIYGSVSGRFIQNVTVMPQFPLSGQLAREMWRLEFGTEVDGVLSIDPVALSYLLEATGPVTLPTGDELTAGNAVQLLLVDVYSRYPEPADQDAFFAAAAASVFSAVSSGDLDPVAFIQALGRAGDERRISVWSARDDDQAVLADTTLAGGLPQSDDSVQRFGIYLNDATASKMGPYLQADAALTQFSCRDDGLPLYQVTLNLQNIAPADAATSLPDYVTAGTSVGVAKGDIKVQALVYGAPGMTTLGVLEQGQTVPFQPSTDSGRAVSALEVQLAPGETTVLQYGFLGDRPFDGRLDALATPTINKFDLQTVDLPCASALW